jgi:hypothetical protein
MKRKENQNRKDTRDRDTITISAIEQKMMF